MHDTMFHIGGFIVGGDMINGLHDPALINGHIHNDRPGCHGLHNLLADKRWRFGARDQHRTDQQVRRSDSGRNIGRAGCQRLDLIAESIVQLAQPIQIQIQNRHIRPKAKGNFGSIGTYRTAANNDDLAAAYARHTG